MRFANKKTAVIVGIGAALVAGAASVIAAEDAEQSLLARAGDLQAAAR